MQALAQLKPDACPDRYAPTPCAWLTGRGPDMYALVAPAPRSAGAPWCMGASGLGLRGLLSARARRASPAGPRAARAPREPEQAASRAPCETGRAGGCSAAAARPQCAASAQAAPCMSPGRAAPAINAQVSGRVLLLHWPSLRHHNMSSSGGGSFVMLPASRKMGWAAPGHPCL